MENKNIVITGSNRGIGLEMAKQLSDKNNVMALCRKSSSELQELDVSVLENIDMGNDESIFKIKEQLSFEHVDVLINNAGIYHRHEDSITDLDINEMTKEWEINTLAPLKVTQVLLPLMKPGSKIAMITSRMGSLLDNTSGTSYGYRMSKTALNMGSLCLAQELLPQEIFVGIIHPGFVKTDMTDHNGLIEPAEAAKGIIQRIVELDVSTSGQFFHQNGEILPW